MKDTHDMEMPHLSWGSLPWEQPVLMLILCGTAICLWNLEGARIPPTSWREVQEILPHLLPLWSQQGGRILPLVLLLFILAGELPGAFIFFAAGLLIGVRFVLLAAPLLGIAQAGIPRSRSSVFLQPTSEPEVCLQLTTRTWLLSYGDEQAVRATLLSERLVGEALCSLCVLVDGRSSAEHEVGAASFLVTQILRDLLASAIADPTRVRGSFKHLLVQGLEQANTALFQHNQTHTEPRRASVVALIVLEQVAYLAHIGNNRVYIYREGLHQVTADHEDARQIGAANQVLCDVMSIPLQRGDILLLCSEGVWRTIVSGEIEQIIAGNAEVPRMVEHIRQVVQQRENDGGAGLIVAHLHDKLREGGDRDETASIAPGSWW